MRNWVFSINALLYLNKWHKFLKHTCVEKPKTFIHMEWTSHIGTKQCMPAGDLEHSFTKAYTTKLDQVLRFWGSVCLQLSQNHMSLLLVPQIFQHRANESKIAPITSYHWLSIIIIITTRGTSGGICCTGYIRRWWTTHIKSWWVLLSNIDCTWHIPFHG